jgi:parallel beta-helix repeat protein
MRHSLLIIFILLTFQQTGFAKTYTVSQGMSIQEVVDKAEEGDTVQILPGEYYETVSITTPGITVKGFEYEGDYTVFNGRNVGGGFLQDAIFVKASNVTLKDLKIQSYENIAIQASSVDNLSMTGIDISRVNQIGVSLKDVSNSLLDGCQIRDAENVGITLNDSREVVIQESQIYQNAVGIEIKDSIKVTLKEISIFHNGSGVYLEGQNTDEEIKSSHITIKYCRFVGNEGNASLKSISSGIGLFVNGYDHVEVSHSYFESNSTYGIVVQANKIEENEFVSNHVYVHHNHYGQNGTKPDSEFLTSFPEAVGGDILFDGTGERNQFQEKTELKTWPKELVQELGGVHTEMMHFI